MLPVIVFAFLEDIIGNICEGGKGHKYLKDVNVAIHCEESVVAVKPDDCVMFITDTDCLQSTIMSKDQWSHQDFFDTRNATITAKRAVELVHEVNNS